MKINKTKKPKPRPVPRTHEGARSVHVPAVAELRRAVMANMLFEDSFYESGEDIAARIGKLTGKVSIEQLTEIAIEAREKMKLRHVPLLLARHALYHHKGRQVGDLIARVIRRPDELGELLALYRATGGKGTPSQLKQGLARALKKFSEYQLAKWNQDSEFTLRDVLFLSHARPHGVKVNEAKNIAEPRYTRKERKAGRRRKLNDHEQLMKRVTEESLATPDTWEVALSEGGDKKATFTRLLEENKLGALALLRNLRGMLAAGVSEDLIRAGLGRMNVERVLPFRFITAARYAPRLEDALEQAMFSALAAYEKLEGKTALLIDHSSSMNAPVSEKSEVTRFDAAAGVAMILREKAEFCRIFTFSDAFLEIPPRRGFSMLEALNKVRKPNGTMLGAAVHWVYKFFPECNRIIVITDEQSADQPPAPRGTGYIVNVGSNQNGIGYGPWVTINGWSEAVLDYIRASESEVG